MSLSGDLTDSFMKTSSNGNRLNSAIPIGIHEKSLAATVLEMSERLDQFLTTKILFSKDYDALRTMGRMAKTGAAISIQIQEEANKKYTEAIDRLLFNNLLQKLDTQIEEYRHEREALETILITEDGEDFIVDMVGELSDLMLMSDSTLKLEYVVWILANRFTGKCKSLKLPKKSKVTLWMAGSMIENLRSKK